MITITEVIEKAVVDPYDALFEHASKLYKDESARQSCTATMYIRFNDLCKNNVGFANLIKQLQEQASTPADTPATDNADVTALKDEIMKAFYSANEPLFAVYPKARKYADEMFKDGKRPSFSEATEKMKDYIYRNGMEYGFICTILPRQE